MRTRCCWRGWPFTNIYGPTGRRLALVDANANRTTFAYDNAGRRVAIRNTLNQIVTSGYAAAGRMTQRINARMTYAYDAASRLSLHATLRPRPRTRPPAKLENKES